ncbi:MAG: hypothetical protein PHS98_04575 [Bacilli bacterium]|nr:hypothetical protein [Bacilli bacterium]
MKKFLQEKLFGWGKKNPIYKQVVDDLYDKNILDDGLSTLFRTVL